MGASKGLKRARKTIARRKVKNGKKSPWGKGFKGPVPNGRGSSGFWLVPENLCIFLPNHRAARLGAISRLLTPYIHPSQLLAICLLEEKSSNHSTKCRGDRSTYPLETRRKYAGPFAGIVTLAHLTN